MREWNAANGIISLDSAANLYAFGRVIDETKNIIRKRWAGKNKNSTKKGATICLAFNERCQGVYTGISNYEFPHTAGAHKFVDFSSNNRGESKWIFHS